MKFSWASEKAAICRIDKKVSLQPACAEKCLSLDFPIQCRIITLPRPLMHLIAVLLQLISNPGEEPTVIGDSALIYVQRLSKL